MSVQSYIEKLRQTLHEANEAYYVRDNPVMSDAEFDRLLRELKQLELQYPEYADPNSPTARVGGRLLDGFEKVKHQTRMLSLDNAFTAQEVWQFFKAPAPVVLEPKVDGLSLSLRYEQGKLALAATRGNGDEGDVVTDNARTIRTIPLVLREPLTLEVRGEVYMPKSQFDALNQQRERDGEPAFANPRNAASGTMKLHDTREVAARKLGFCAYSVLSAGLDTQLEALELLRRLGFETPLDTPLKGKNEAVNTVKVIAAPTQDAWLAALEAQLSWLCGLRYQLEYDIDGAVLKLNSLRQQEELGCGTKSPKWAVAFKYPPERKPTALLGITLTVGRTGQVTPNAVLSPVCLGGSVVKAASLCNQAEINRLGVNVGDTVLVEKSAEIIPKIYPYPEGRVYTCARCQAKLTLASLPDNHASLDTAGLKVTCHGARVDVARQVWEFPRHCPCCGTALVQRGVHHFCPNSTCPDQVKNRLKYAVSKLALDWEGLGDAQVAELYNQGFRKLSDLFTKTPKLTEKALKKFTAERERAKAAPLWRKLVALGVDGLGVTLCKELALKYRSIEAIAQAPRAEVEKLIGEVNYASLADFILNQAEELERLVSAGFTLAETSKPGKLSGKEFVITGTLLSGTRAEVAARIEAEGGVVKNAVSRKTTYLIVGTGGGANKAAAAAKYGTTCLTEEEFYNLLGAPPSLVVKPDEL
jgi:DNA ligase (NAD+)